MVFENLKASILAGTFCTGDLLPTQEVLAQRYGVSRTVMREAFNKLSSLGLIKSFQGRGTYVRSPDMQAVMGPMLSSLTLDEGTIRELMETRYHLESTIVRLAARHATEQQIRDLEETVACMEKGLQAGDIKSFAQADLNFHILLADISRNRVLKRIIEVIREMLVKFLEGFNQVAGAPERAIAYHKKICCAIARHDSDQAEKQMRQHILDVLHTLRVEYRISVDV
jgi:GntR family transcriptional repressor for pyruvate dehydrogenase complex